MRRRKRKGVQIIIIAATIFFLIFTLIHFSTSLSEYRVSREKRQGAEKTLKEYEAWKAAVLDKKLRNQYTGNFDPEEGEILKGIAIVGSGPTPMKDKVYTEDGERFKIVEN